MEDLKLNNKDRQPVTDNLYRLHVLYNLTQKMLSSGLGI